MVEFEKAKGIFRSGERNFQKVYEKSTQKGRRKCFETNNSTLESWKEKYENQPLGVCNYFTGLKTNDSE